MDNRFDHSASIHLEDEDFYLIAIVQKVTGEDSQPEQHQFALLMRHQTRGTSPGNPRWYKIPKAPEPFRFKPGMPPVFPRWVACKAAALAFHRP